MTDRAVLEAEAIKRLLVLLLVKLGASSDEIGLALNVSGQRVRQLVPTKRIQKIVFHATKE
jgi:hypothetical protein